jgi:hypothetical protein
MMTREYRWLYFQMKGVPAPRAPRHKSRRGPPRSDRYLRWIRTFPSVVSGRIGCEAAHTGRDGGMRMKASDFSVAPLTVEEHREYHAIGRERFEEKHGISFRAIVEEFNRQWIAKGGRLA